MMIYFKTFYTNDDSCPCDRNLAEIYGVWGGSPSITLDASLPKNPLMGG
jgi:hypothetical protein